MKVGLPKVLQKSPFTLQQAKKCNLTFHEIRTLLKLGEIEQLARGIYRVPQPDFSEEEQFQVATLLVGYPSAICLISALAFYGLTDLIPKKTWVLVPNAKRTNVREIKLFRVRDPQWDIGIHKAQGYQITSVERSLVEAIVYKRIVGSSTGVDALKRALKEGKIELKQILDIARDLDVEHRILPYIEVLT